MSPAFEFIIAVALLTTLVQSAPKSHDKHDKLHTCQDFTRGQVFNDSQAVGIWHLLHFKTEKANGTGDSRCMQFVPVDEQERKGLKDLIEKYVENLKWESVTLKMEIPCTNFKANRTQGFYLERLDGDGSYRTLQMPAQNATLNLANFHRYPLRLKIIEGQYLGMMDCHEKFMFLLGKQPPEGEDLDERLQKMIEAYWPDES